jgi:ribosomal protein L7/L12
MQQFTDALVHRTNEAVDRRLKRGGTTSIATFSRGDRDIDVPVDIPVNPDAKVDFDVVLISHNGKKRQVTIAVRDVAKLKMGPSIKLVEALPQTILRGASEADAEQARAELAAAGGTVEVR